jgi:hypothetical protein
MQWDDETLRMAKETLRQCEGLQDACATLSDELGELVTRHKLRHAFLREGLPPPGSYLNGGAEASMHGDHPGHRLINKNPDYSEYEVDPEGVPILDEDGNFIPIPETEREPQTVGTTTPPGYILRGVSSLVDEHGRVKQQWVKTKLDTNAQLDMLRVAVEKIADPIKGESEFVPLAEHEYNDDLLTVYPMGDPHIGMYAWHEETGEDFDLQIAEQDLFGAVDHLVAQAPRSRVGLIVNLGDFFHSDSMDNRTLRSGNALDVDGRWPKVVAVGLRTIRRCIDRALEHHETVHVINAIGNHDDHTAMMLSITLNEYYSNNPRVVVDTSPRAHHYYKHGRVLLGVTHGHQTKPPNLMGVMATDRAEDWGQTTFRHWLTGHVHHDQKKEYAGCTFESFRTLASKDAWAAHHGYRAERDMKAIVYHADYGEVIRHTSNIRLVRALQGRK